MASQLRVSLFIGLILLLIIQTGHSLEIYNDWSNDGSNNLSRLQATYFSSDRIVLVELEFILDYSINYLQKHPFLQVRINPWEHSDWLPVQNFTIKVCDGVGCSKCREEDSRKFNCTLKNQTTNQTFIFKNKPINLTTMDKTIRITDFDDSKWGQFAFHVSYIIPNAIQKQDDLYFVPINYENLKFKEIYTTFFFPSKTSVPRFIPENLAKIQLFPILKDDKVFWRWSYSFEGDSNRIFFWQDYGEVQQKRRELVFLGVFLGIIGAVVILPFEDFFKSSFKKIFRYFNRLKNKKD